ncbi:hypothetical protein FOA52_000379 [Chlamydomonas sp. UWO 241]|nr:hypothetical protein FOA52_000379 [Chlamydomonas sp. UWO 241]
MMRGTRVLYAALSVLALGAACVSADDYSRAYDTAPPLAYTALNGHLYVLFGDTAFSGSQVWPAASVVCERLGGNLTSITSDAEAAVIIQLHRNLVTNVGGGGLGGTPYGNASLCAWVGISNVFADPATWTDGATLDYIESHPPWDTVNTTFVKASIALGNATQFNNDVGCGALCGSSNATSYYLRDCDFESQAFVCKVAVGTILPGTPIAITAPTAGAATDTLVTDTTPKMGHAITTVETAPGSGVYPAAYPYVMPATAPAPHKCADYRGYTFCGTVDPQTWSDAQHACRTSGKGQLVTISSLSEFTFVLGQFQPNSSVPAFWTGAVKPGYNSTLNAGQSISNAAFINSLTLTVPEATYAPTMDWAAIGLLWKSR